EARPPRRLLRRRAGRLAGRDARRSPRPAHARLHPLPARPGGARLHGRRRPHGCRPLRGGRRHPSAGGPRRGRAPAPTDPGGDRISAALRLSVDGLPTRPRPESRPWWRGGRAARLPTPPLGRRTLHHAHRNGPEGPATRHHRLRPGRARKGPTRRGLPEGL
ncbi:uncharacterized protein METZ01_LOCUS353114, partial [marine metagenome]